MVIMAIIVIGLYLSQVPQITALGSDVPVVYGAHRGSSVKYMENSMDALKEALNDDKYEFIEFDIQYTKDKKIVIYHDTSLVRLEQKQVWLEDVTYEELQEISDYDIPLYEDVMDLIGKDKILNVEIKSQGNYEYDMELANFLIKDLEDREILDDTLVSSVSGKVVQYLSETYPDVKTGKIYWVVKSTYFNIDQFTEDLYNTVDSMGADYLMLHGHNIRNYKSLKEHKPDNIDLAFWYFDDSMYIVGEDSKWW